MPVGLVLEALGLSLALPSFTGQPEWAIIPNMIRTETVVILAGGKGTRLSEETTLRPKPMVEILGVPLIVRIMNHYASYGFRDFIVCAGYKGEVIKDYFWDFHRRNSDVEVDLGSGARTVLSENNLDWRVKVVDTGLETMTGGRLLRVKEHLTDTFLMTYGDGVSDVDLGALLSFHRGQQSLATLTSVLEPTRFAILDVDSDSRVKRFQEKPESLRRRINGGFFVLQKEVLNLIQNDETVFEQDPLESLASAGQLSAFRHDGFWYAVDSLRDKVNLESVLKSSDFGF
jgi:glucose-1-phosphate cytidylyltransferase